MRVRKNNRVWVLALGVFVAVFLFTFLTEKYKNNEIVEAANLGAFDPGYIISDYQMGNYNSMNEAEIQAFLTAKNSCRNTDYDYYSRLSAGSSAIWHWANGHFVCLSEERFGDGEVIGSGDTAAHIIWQAAQDYKINPQVLIVLLQKETGLITDPIPNNYDYRKATGYGCPDTAACSSKYYGFKNQVRNAAALFRTVLDGGWTNYPLGNNYVQYNPDSGCGGSWVNIRSLATSALYRYTPYQPNAAALAAGYGTGDGCSAYGNRNFYSYFEDWFGGVTDENIYSPTDVPRYMNVVRDTYYINPKTGAKVLKVLSGTVMKFSTKTLEKSGEWCIRTDIDYRQNLNRCILRKDLEELSFSPVEDVRYMVVKNDTNYINPRTLMKGERVSRGTVMMFATKILDSNDNWCIRTLGDTEKDINRCIERGNLENTMNYISSVTPRYMKLIADTSFVVPHTLKVEKMVGSDEVFYFTSKILDVNGNWCLRTEEDTYNNINRCINRNMLDEVDDFVPSITAREMKVIDDTSYINPHTLEEGSAIKKGQVFNFTTKIIDGNGDWCIRTEEDTLNGRHQCIKRAMLEDI